MLISVACEPAFLWSHSQSHTTRVKEKSFLCAECKNLPCCCLSWWGSPPTPWLHCISELPAFPCLGSQGSPRPVCRLQVNVVLQPSLTTAPTRGRQHLAPGSVHQGSHHLWAACPSFWTAGQSSADISKPQTLRQRTLWPHCRAVPQPPFSSAQSA